MVTKTRNRMINGAAIIASDFGVVGDGVADDYHALQSAINAAAAARTTLFLQAGATYDISYALLLPEYTDIDILGRGNCIIRKTTDNGLETPKSVTNKGIVYNLSQNAVFVIDTADSGNVANYTYNVGVKGVSLAATVNQDFSIYAPRCAYMKLDEVAVYNSTVGYWTHNTWKSQIDLTGNATVAHLCQFMNDGSGVGTGTSCDFTLWHKGDGNALYAYGLTYSKINRVILEGISSGNSAGSLGVIELASCRGVDIEQIGVEVVTLSSGSLLRATGSGSMTVGGSDLNHVTLGAGTYLFNLSGVHLDYTGTHSSCNDSAASAVANITNGASLTTDTNSLVLNGWTKKCLVDIADGSYLKDRKTSRNFHRDGADLSYSHVGNYRDFGHGFTTPPNFGTHWKNGDKLWQNAIERIGGAINDPLCWIQDGDGAPNFVTVWAGKETY